MKKFITRYILPSLIIIAIAACSGEKKSSEEHDHAATPQTAASGNSKSPASQAMTNIGQTHVHIEYHAPSVRGRQIFGGLVAYNEVWVTGAHSATSINFPNDVSLNGNKVPKGKYALFTIPGESEWTVIINENYEQHLADDYDEKLDVARLKVRPEKLAETQEQLLYKVEETATGKGIISISWADVKISFEVTEL
ncbi:MAG: DUF2911 domain-containing protein [Roseivirga sp.]|nr:DUF2911 domain-containing protein [Roseivirga sp.]